MKSQFCALFSSIFLMIATFEVLAPGGDHGVVAFFFGMTLMMFLWTIKEIVSESKKHE